MQNEIRQLAEAESNGTRIAQNYYQIIKPLKFSFLISFFFLFLNLKIINPNSTLETEIFKYIPDLLPREQIVFKTVITIFILQ